MTSGDEDLLKQILAAGVLEWVVGARGVRIPKVALKKLAEARLVDVETRRCSTWSFGPKYPHFNTADYKSVYAEWQEAQRVRVFRDRSVVVATATVLGQMYAVENGLINEV